MFLSMMIPGILFRQTVFPFGTATIKQIGSRFDNPFILCFYSMYDISEKTNDKGDSYEQHGNIDH